MTPVTRPLGIATTLMRKTACRLLTVAPLAQHDRQGGVQFGIQLGELLQTLQIEIVQKFSGGGEQPTTVVDFSDDEPVLRRRGAGDPTPFE